MMRQDARGLSTKGLQTMSNIRQVPEELNVGRSDPVYMAHGYLTKVPVPAIKPFIEAYTKPGDVVVDPFAGSGMTGVAAAALGRSARLFDISVLGQHIGRNYSTIVDPDMLRKQASEAVAAVTKKLGNLYSVRCEACSGEATLVKAIWSLQVECSGCSAPVSYFRAMEAASWSKSAMCCPGCGARVSTKDKKVGERAEVDAISCACSPKQREQPAAAKPHGIDIETFAYPRVEITPDRQMYKAQSLARSGLTTVASYYSARNLAILTTLHEQITEVPDEFLRRKLLFAFTAILTRASKRYQWSPMRPLNAANANYYVAPVFYEWNIFELYLRKVEAVIRSDDWLRSVRGEDTLFSAGDFTQPDVRYEIGSAESIDLPDNSVDYIFTDPPFGSNLFYADMALFQEAWLGGFTDVDQEAVVDRGSKKQRSASRYEEMLTAALRECRRVLKVGGRVSMVFGNSSGSMWSLVQRAIRNAGFRIQPNELVVLNKGQRSVKGLASGFEHVATLDLIMTMTVEDSGSICLITPGRDAVAAAALEFAASGDASTPSHIYLELLRRGIKLDWDLSTIDLRVVTQALVADGWDVALGTGLLSKAG